MAPMLDIIMTILIDIGYFMAILLIFGFVFSAQYFLIAQNQLMFDDLSDAEKLGLNYKTFYNAIWFTYDIVLGNGSRANFDIGANNSQSDTLHLLFLFSTFILLIHLLNMLIAIMGESFGDRRAVADQIKVKDHLRFVMGNWHLKNLSFRDMKKIRYIITAFHDHEEQNDDFQQISNLRDDVQLLGESIK